MAKNNGNFIISLDFELLWGVFDHETKESYRERILGARKAIPRLLELFKKYDIHATWGVVGLLMAENKNEQILFSPTCVPKYTNNNLSAYNHMQFVGNNEDEDYFHFANSLVNLILKYENQEIASHTYSHYYCNEDGQNETSFKEDLVAAKTIAKEKFNIDLKSIILPRNQINSDYIDAIDACGFYCVRGNKESFAYNSNNLIARGSRLLDSYFNLFGKKTYGMSECSIGNIVNLRGSSFFRSYNHKLRYLEKLKINNIKKNMLYAAKHGCIYHLWWHPHNMGQNTEIFFEQLEEILLYYSTLKNLYNYQSCNMNEIAEEFNNENCNAM